MEEWFKENFGEGSLIGNYAGGLAGGFIGLFAGSWLGNAIGDIFGEDSWLGNVLGWIGGAAGMIGGYILGNRLAHGEPVFGSVTTDMLDIQQLDAQMDGAEISPDNRITVLTTLREWDRAGDNNGKVSAEELAAAASAGISNTAREAIEIIEENATELSVPNLSDIKTALGIR